MGTISYKLSSKINTKGESQIYIDILSDRTTHYRLKSGIYITPENYERLIKSDRILSIEWLSKFDEMLHLPCTKEKAMEVMEKAKGGTSDILTLYDEFVRRRMIEKGLTKGTEDMYHNVRVLICEFLGGRPTSPKMMDSEFLNKFLSLMTDKGMKNTTQQNYWRLMKVFISELVKQGIIHQTILMYKPKFKMAENDVVYLTHNELYRLYGLELKKASERIVRDCFCIQCFTGLRHSDLMNIRKENIKEDVNGKYISLLTKKTNQRLKIYFNNNARDILENYDWTLPVLNKWRMNYNLPEICRKAGIDGDVEIIRYVGSERTVEHKRKWECISTHTGRRTFVCLCIENGISTSVIRGITGHKSISSFERYVGISDKNKSDVMTKLEI